MDSYYNNNWGYVAVLNDCIYYTDSETLYVKNIKSGMEEQIVLYKNCFLQSVDDEIYVYSYDNGNNYVYNASTTKLCISFVTEKKPKKIQVNKYGCFYLIDGILDCAPAEETKIEITPLSNVTDYIITEGGIYYLRVSNITQEETKSFSDLSEFTPKTELLYKNWNEKEFIIATWDGIWDPCLTAMNDGALYYDDNYDVIYTHGITKDIMFNEIGICDLIADSKNIYYFNTFDNESKCFCTSNKVIDVIGDFKIKGIANNMVYGSDYQWH